MILGLIIYTVLFLLVTWLGTLVISITFFFIDLLVRKNIKNDSIGTIILVVTMIAHFTIGFYLQFYLLIKLSKIFIDKYNRLTIFLIIPLLLAYSLIKHIGEYFNNQIAIDENKFIASGEYYKRNADNMMEISTRGMRASFLTFINLFGTILSIGLFLLYYFNQTIFEWCLRYIP